MDPSNRVELVPDIKDEEIRAALTAWSFGAVSDAGRGSEISFPMAEEFLDKNFPLSYIFKTLMPNILEMTDTPNNESTRTAFLVGSCAMVEILSQIVQIRHDFDQAGKPTAD